MSTLDNYTCLHCPTIEDRLQNTENLIKEMNAKFEDIASTKNSAKNELNKLVKTLTMNSDYHNNTWMLNANSESNSDDDQADHRMVKRTKDNNMLSSGDEDDCSNNSSFDEETCNLNRENLNQILSNISKQKQALDQSRRKPNYIEIQNQKGKSNKRPERGTFSNSRYEVVDNEDNHHYYDNQNELMNEGSDEDTNQYSDQLYQNAKESLTRTKILLMSSQKDMQLYNQLGYTDDNDVEIIEMNTNRVKNILRNKEKRKGNKEFYSEETKKFLDEGSANESSNSNPRHFSDIDPASSQNSDQRFMVKEPSRNHLNSRPAASGEIFDPNRYIHQTTSSGNLVLYDSVNKISNKNFEARYNIVREQNYNTKHHIQKDDEVSVIIVN